MSDHLKGRVQRCDGDLANSLLEGLEGSFPPNTLVRDLRWKSFRSVGENGRGQGWKISPGGLRRILTLVFSAFPGLRNQRIEGGWLQRGW